jgi:hypothetical protein
LTEAVGIPHKKGQAEIEIPEKLRSETKWLLSEEYQERLLKAAAKARGENPERPSQETTVQSNTHQKGQNETHNDGTANNPLIERDEFYPAFWDRLLKASGAGVRKIVSASIFFPTTPSGPSKFIVIEKSWGDLSSSVPPATPSRSVPIIFLGLLEVVWAILGVERVEYTHYCRLSCIPRGR